MWRTFLLSLALLSNTVAGCDPAALIAHSADPGAYEVLALVAD